MPVRYSHSSLIASEEIMEKAKDYKILETNLQAISSSDCDIMHRLRLEDSTLKLELSPEPAIPTGTLSGSFAR